MFHIFFGIISRYLYFGNALQGFARGIFALRIISSNLLPSISPPPPTAFIDASFPFVGPPGDILPYPSAGLIALERTGRQPPSFASPLPYQSSLITLPPSQLPIFLPLLIIMVAVTSGFIIVLPGIYFMNVFGFVSHLLQRAVGPVVAMLQWCGLLATQDTRRSILDGIYQQITRGTSEYDSDDLIDSGDVTYGYVEGRAVADVSLPYPDLARDEIPEAYRLRLQKIYNQFVDTQDLFRKQLELSHAKQRESHADLLAAEQERERLVSMRQRALARCEEAEVTVSKLRADLSAAAEHLDRQAEAKDQIIQSITEKSQVAHVRLKYAEDKITHLNAKVQSERDRRHRKTKELLVEQVRVQDLHESEIRRLKQEVQDAQEQLDSLRGTISELHANERSPLDTCQPPLPSYPHAPPISPPTNVEYSPSQGLKDVSIHQDPPSEVKDHWATLEELFERMRGEDNESAQDDAVKPHDELQEGQSRLQDELEMTREQLCLVEEEYSSVRRDLDQSRVALQEVKGNVVSLRSEWEMCKSMLWEAQDARRSSLTELAEVMKLLRVSQAEWEESQFRCSQVTFLCTALQDRVTELEAKFKKRKKRPTRTPVHTADTGTAPSDVEAITHEQELPVHESLCRSLCLTDTSTAPPDVEAITLEHELPVHTQPETFESRSYCPTDTDTAPSDVEAITHEHELESQNPGSINMIIPPLQPWILDFSLPSSSSPGSLYLSDQERSAKSPAPSDIHLHSLCHSDTDIRSIPCNSTDSFLFELELSLAFPPCDSNSNHHYEVGLGDEQDVQQSAELVRSAVDPGSANPDFTSRLLPPSSPSSKGVSGLLRPNYRASPSERNSLGSMDWPPIGSALSPGSGDVRQGRKEDADSEEGTDDSILRYQAPLSPFQESEPVLDRKDPKPSGSSIIIPSSPRKFSHREEGYPLRQVRSSVTNASPTSSSNRLVSVRSPHHSPPPSNLPPAPLLEPQDEVSIDSVPNGTVQSLKGRRRPSYRRGFSRMQDDIPVPKLDYDLPADFVPGFQRTGPKRQVVDVMPVDEFAFLIPLDCKTSTPVAAGRRARTLKKGLPVSSGEGRDGLDVERV